jgi:hypothetical protein
MAVESHLQLPYLCLCPLWSYILMHDAIMKTVLRFLETPFPKEGPAVIWDEISVINIIAVLHTYKGYAHDMLEKEVGELTYAQTMWIPGEPRFGLDRCASSADSGPTRGHKSI